MPEQQGPSFDIAQGVVRVKGDFSEFDAALDEREARLTAIEERMKALRLAEKSENVNFPELTEARLGRESPAETPPEWRDDERRSSGRPDEADIDDAMERAKEIADRNRMVQALEATVETLAQILTKLQENGD